MVDYVIMPKADYVAACDKIRERTGKTDLIKSGELATEIDSITGGGDSNLVKYVTFKGADGAELYKMPVLNGDNCKDPYTYGYISKPTKESTVAEVFDHSGWSFTDGGDADSTALQNVTEDRTVYAAFTSSVRQYTATFYDGDTVIATVPVDYGTKATPPDTTRDGYTFDGWTPSDLTCYGDTSFYGTWSEVKGWYRITTIADVDTSLLECLSVSNDGTKVMATAYRSYNKTPRIFDISSNGETTEISHSENSSSFYYAGVGFCTDSESAVLVLDNGSTMSAFSMDLSSAESNYLFAGQDWEYAENKVSAISPLDDSVVIGGLAHKALNNTGFYLRKYTFDGSTWKQAAQFSQNGATSYGYEVFGKFGCISTDGSYFVQSNGKIHSMSTLDVTKTIPSTDKTKKISWNKDGNRIAVTDSSTKKIKIYNYDDLSVFMNFSSYLSLSNQEAVFAPSGNDLFVWSYDSGNTQLHVFDTSSETPVAIENIPTPNLSTIVNVGVSLNGRYAVIGGEGGIEVWGKY